MSLIKLTVANSGLRLEVNAKHVVFIRDNGESTNTTVGLSTGESVDVKESGRSVRGYVKKALAPVGVAAAPEVAE
ncbi:hypothetical protein FROZEN_41 [Erwinia phage vB_EamP_Frozen]|uniref:Uncharacterized protein n=3 Tax=Johnsonvirus frozen TaxID=1982578 RepID=A0A191ZD05_9CAUD|nr:hypothetical protein FROZEN_41 [Erwinia phage vB_EamP_Frozen]ANJ65171.1 hypothetical protein FROZEN_41 [Erwinia phage vB_EamP_Frozen]ANJ65269.1 hypothetical protein REXELLA_40 [Erwinia phage vB_EamP_Rexella]ANJ65347.1 hypothetical protein GUTMEISTER_33 [Erwinia phage vB_EamP_Gutmeister]